MTDQDRCNKFTPHPTHSRFGLKDCPGVPMTSRDELREERVRTGRLEGDLRSQTRAVREALAERDEAARICGEAGIEIDRLRAERDEALDDRDQARRERDQNAADLQAIANTNDQLREQLADMTDPRRLLDQAIESALPLAGGRVRKLLKALRRELVNVDAKRAERAEG